METKIPQPPIGDQVKEFVQAQITLLKYKAIDKGTSLGAEIIVNLVVAILMILVFLFGSLTLGFYLAGILKSNWSGFGCVTGLYILITLGILFFKKGIEKPLINTMITRLLK